MEKEGRFSALGTHVTSCTVLKILSASPVTDLCKSGHGLESVRLTRE